MHFLTQLAKEQRTQQTRDPEFYIIDMPFCDSPEFDPIELQRLADLGDLLRIARQAIQRLAHDNVNSAIAHVIQQSARTPTIPAIAGDFWVKIGVHYLATEQLDKLLAGGSLV